MDVTPLGDRLVRITLTGRLDTQGVDRVETKFLSSIMPGGLNVLIDLSQVEFIASMGIRMLVSAARNLKVRDAKLALFGVPEAIGQVFEAVALHKIIPVCATEADARAAIEAIQA